MIFGELKRKKMEMEVGESYIKRTLKNLCLNYGWSYGVYWQFYPKNDMFLTLEDAYYEGYAENLVSNMVAQVHMLGEGTIGEAAVHGQHRWFFNSLEDPQVCLQFSSGIKTIAVIPLELQGVVQFGSTNEISETLEFLDQARKLLQNHKKFEGPTPGSNSDQNGLFTSVTSSQNPLCDDLSASLANNVEVCSLMDSLDFPEEFILDPSLQSFNGDFEPAQISPSLLDSCQIDDLSQWLDDASKLCISELDLEALLSDDMSSDLGQNNFYSSIQGAQPSCSSQSPLTALDSCGQEKPLVIGTNNNEVVTEFGVDYGCEAKINPLHNDLGTSFSECISEVGGHSTTLPKKGLFSELGLDQLLKDVSGSYTSKSCIEGHWPSLRKRKTYQRANYQFPHNYDPWGVKVIQPTTTGVQKHDFGSLKNYMEKAQGRLWVDESFRMDSKSCISGVSAQSRKSEEPLKTSKKRAKPGESTRPRPKDRQLISDRIKDLRDLIPNGAKLSIDALLGRTIKHMLFLHNLNKHATKLKQDEPKLISQDNSLIQKGSSSMSPDGNGGRGATWAYEIGSSNMLCPIIVEDLNEPGQMLIEMLCEERGYFLEVADIVRSFGLTILKGVMEARNDKIWAHFIVEGNKHITRMDVFVSLMQLLQSTNTSEVPNTTWEPPMVGTGASPVWGDFQQHMVPLPIQD